MLNNDTFAKPYKRFKCYKFRTEMRFPIGGALIFVYDQLRVLLLIFTRTGLGVR